MTESGLNEPEDDATDWRETPLGVDEADAAEQERAVEIDDDEYR